MSTKAYWSDVRFVFPTDEGPRETSMMIEYLAESDGEALHSAVRFARDRERCFRDNKYSFSSLKTGRFQPDHIAQGGTFSQPRGWGFFEWKNDWPGSLDERIAAFVKERPA